MLQTYLAFFPGSLNKEVTELLVFNIARTLCYIKDSLLTDRVHSRWLEVAYVCFMVWPQVFNKHRLNIPLECDLDVTALFTCVTSRARANFLAIFRD